MTATIKFCVGTYNIFDNDILDRCLAFPHFLFPFSYHTLPTGALLRCKTDGEKQ